MQNINAEEDELNYSINTTPLVDVMLVLLIIFLITIPVVISTHPVSLPRESNVPTLTKPENINIAVEANGNYYWNDQYIPDLTTIIAELKIQAAKKPQPEIHIRGDENVHYAAIGKIVRACQLAGISRIGFVTEPQKKS